MAVTPLREQVNSLQHFQQHSRLHFIGQWRTRANEELAKWFQQHPEWNHGKLSQQSVFVHIDMDAFFCSVQLAKEQYKDLRELPVAIAAGSHNSDISSCNYVARARGVYAGMYVNSAKLVCPDLVVLGYDLQACERVAKHLYEILLTSTEPSMHMAMEVYSIDEVMMAFDNLDYDGLRVYCERVRERLREETGCTASCGIGPNIMLARLSTERAKPDGIYMVRPEDVARVMRSIAFSSVHGVGDVTLAKVLEAVNGLRGADDAIHDPTHLMCTDVQRLSIEALQAVLGKKAGQSFYNLCRGVDGRVVLRTGDAAEQQTKGIPSSVGCSMNYAVRPHTVEDVWSIAAQLLDDVCRKLQLHNATASGLRMTLLERHPLHSRETQKFLGRGRCLEFHFSTRFAHPLLSSNADLMLAALSSTIAPFLTLSREQSDENRAAELGLSEDSGEMEWTVNIAEAKNIVVCDVRGMTVQATGLKVIEEVAVDRTIRGGAGQLTLASAFAKGKRRRTEAVEVGATQLSQRQWPTTVLSLTDDGTPASQHDFFFAQPWDEHVDVVWRSELRRAATQRDYPYAKALLRWALVKVMESGGDDAAHFGQHFGSLLDYSRTVLDVEIDFL